LKELKTSFLKTLILILTVTMIYSCKTDDDVTGGNTTAAAFEGTWKAEDVQLISAPDTNPGIWKPALVLYGSVGAATVGDLQITFQANGNWIATGFLTNNVIKAMVKDNQNGSTYSANGRYTKTNNDVTIYLDNYTGRGVTTGQTICSYSISGNKMTLTVDLPHNEKWQIIFGKQ